MKLIFNFNPGFIFKHSTHCPAFISHHFWHQPSRQTWDSSITQIGTDKLESMELNFAFEASNGNWVVVFYFCGPIFLFSSYFCIEIMESKQKVHFLKQGKEKDVQR